MQKFTERFEARFEKGSEFVTHILGHSIIIILVMGIVFTWIFMVFMSDATVTEKIRDSFIAISFLTFFLVQRALNKYNLAIHVKLNELVRAQDNASNDFINVEKKTHKEIDELAKEMHEDAEEIKKHES